MEKINEKKLKVLRDSISSLNSFANDLCEVRPELYEIKREEWTQEIENIRKQIYAKQVLLFIGPFSSGKSSFINALLGENILPTNNRPCTAVVTELTFVDGGGHRGRAVRKDNGVLDEEYDFETLLKFIDGPTGAVGECAAYHHIALQYDISQLPYESQNLRQLCDAGVTLVDCPGYGAIYASNEDIIEEYISKASHTFWINPVDRIGSVADRMKLSEIRKKTTTIIPVMSKSDLIDSDSKREEIRDDFAETIGSMFRSKDPIFCSSIKYKQGMDISKKIQKEKLSGSALESANGEMQRLFNESGVSNIFGAIMDSAGEKAVAESKIYSVYHDLTNLTSKVKCAVEQERRHWLRELKKAGWSDSHNCALEEARDEIALWIDGESDRFGRQLDNEIRECIQHYVESCAKSINQQDLQDQVVRIWSNRIAESAESWGKRIAEAYQGKIRVSIAEDGRKFDLPSWLASSDIVAKFTDMRDVILTSIKEAGAVTVIQGGLGTAIWMAAGSLPAWAPAAAGTAVACTGGILLAVAAIGFIPVYSKFSKLKKEEQRRTLEQKINKWLESLRMRESVYGLLTDQNEAVFKKLEKEQQKVAEELIDKKDQCESVCHRIDDMMSALQIQFENVK